VIAPKKKKKNATRDTEESHSTHNREKQFRGGVSLYQFLSLPSPEKSSFFSKRKWVPGKNRLAAQRK